MKQREKLTEDSAAEDEADASSQTLPVEEKHCVKCEKDITHRKRLRGNDGSYWCYSCGAADLLERGVKILASECGRCGLLYHPTQFVRFEDEYMCEDCAEERQARNFRTDGKPRRKASLFTKLFWLAVLVWIAYKFYNHFFPGAPPPTVLR